MFVFAPRFKQMLALVSLTFAIVLILNLFLNWFVFLYFACFGFGFGFEFIIGILNFRLQSPVWFGPYSPCKWFVVAFHNQNYVPTRAESLLVYHPGNL